MKQSSLNSEQIFINDIYSLENGTTTAALDNDECGNKGTKYLRTIFKKVTRFRYLKGIKDPGEMNQESFNKMYKKTMTDYKNNNKK